MAEDTKAAHANVLAQAEAMRAKEKELGEELRREKGACGLWCIAVGWVVGGQR